MKGGGTDAMEASGPAVQEPRPAIEPVTLGHEIAAAIVIGENVSSKITMHQIVGI